MLTRNENITDRVGTYNIFPRSKIYRRNKHCVMDQEITRSLLVVNAYYNQLQSALSGMEGELVIFLSKPRPSNICIQDKQHSTGLIVCVRKVCRSVEQRPIQYCLDICTIVINSPFNKMGAVVNIVKIIHKINPFPLIYLHQVTNTRLDGYLNKMGWIQDKDFNYYQLANPAGRPDTE